LDCTHALENFEISEPGAKSGIEHVFDARSHSPARAFEPAGAPQSGGSSRRSRKSIGAIRTKYNVADKPGTRTIRRRGYLPGCRTRLAADRETLAFGTDRARQPMASQVSFARRRRACLRCNGHGVAPTPRARVWRRKACAANNKVCRADGRRRDKIKVCPADGRGHDKTVGSCCGHAREIGGIEAGRTQAK
jgi:hypothetical protein